MFTTSVLGDRNGAYKGAFHPVMKKVFLPLYYCLPPLPSVPTNRHMQADSIFVPCDPKKRNRVTLSTWPAAAGADPGGWPDDGD